ncbi:MAG: acylphosphatase [Thermoplasmata archaeon]
MKVRLRVIFSGRVQGVFFRANTQRFASSHGVSGWVRNTEEGDVEALFEGEEEAVNAVIRKCQYEQPYARVENIRIFREEPKGDLKGFTIRY